MAEECGANLFDFRQYDNQCSFFGGDAPLPVRSHKGVMAAALILVDGCLSSVCGCAGS